MTGFEKASPRPLRALPWPSIRVSFVDERSEYLASDLDNKFARHAVNNIDRLTAENAELREALKFYQDGFTYHPKRTKTGIDLSEWKPTETLLDDCGERARAALSRTGGAS